MGTAAKQALGYVRDESPARSPRMLAMIVLLLLAGAGIRAIDVWRPVDRGTWRECDLSGIARNYFREDMRLLYPRVDWRGAGPGFAEMEFPILPWTMATLYKLTGGVHEPIGRMLSLLASLAAMVLFTQLARSLLPAAGWAAAAAFFVISPLPVYLATAIQSDGLMLLGCVGGMHYFLRWRATGRLGSLYVAMAFTSLAVLVKATAAHIGLAFLALLLLDGGPSAFRSIHLWMFALGSLLPSALWYTHAHSLWLTYGNSLGVSNEAHWIGLDVVRNTSYLRGIISAEVRDVWTPFGLLLLPLAFLSQHTRAAVRVSVVWLGAVGVYYLAAAGTTGDLWAFYYHVVSVPPAALLFGCAVHSILERVRISPSIATGGGAIVGAVLSLVIGASSGAALPRWPTAVILAVGTAAFVFVVTRPQSAIGPETTLANGPLARYATILAAVSLLAGTGFFLTRGVLKHVGYAADPGIATLVSTFQPHIPAGSLLLVGGGTCVDEAGRAVAYNDSSVFYWLDRKGFNICEQQQTLAAVTGFAQQGAEFYFAGRNTLTSLPEYDQALRRAFPVLAENSLGVLFRLKPAQ